ncbi:hypothetical protein BDZ89DRAFT_1116375 [Hymenopellis radicata]|nr:hypothetical protein BDZ89DRAFT_1116375 [Hymenopellis radicata]
MEGHSEVVSSAGCPRVFRSGPLPVPSTYPVPWRGCGLPAETISGRTQIARQHYPYTITSHSSCSGQSAGHDDGWRCGSKKTAGGSKTVNGSETMMVGSDKTKMQLEEIKRREKNQKIHTFQGWMRPRCLPAQKSRSSLVAEEEYDARGLIQHQVQIVAIVQEACSSAGGGLRVRVAHRESQTRKKVHAASWRGLTRLGSHYQKERNRDHNPV